MNLGEMENGDRAMVTKLLFYGDDKKRIEDLGFTEGAETECVLISPFGDPKAYRIRGTVIALRHEQAALIQGERM